MAKAAPTQVKVVRIPVGPNDVAVCQAQCDALVTAAGWTLTAAYATNGWHYLIFTL